MSAPLPTELAARRAELLVVVRRKAARLRRRRVLFTAAPLAALVAAVALAIPRGAAPRRLDVAAATTTSASAAPTTVAPRSTVTPPATTTVRMPTKTTVSGSASVGPAQRPASPASPTSSVAPRSTPPNTVAVATAPPVCADSYDPACGPFRWQPAPAPDRSLTVSMVVSDASPAAGDDVSVTIDLADGDAAPICAAASLSGTALVLTDGRGRAYPRCVPPPCGPARYGPWTPPPPAGAGQRLFASFGAPAAGRYALTVAASSGSGCAYRPYGSLGGASVTIDVT